MSETMSDRSPEINELAAALAKAQAAMTGATKDAANPFFKTNYADLASIWHAWRPHGPTNGLAIIQKVRTVENKAQCETILVHASGQWISETLTLPVAKFDAQGVGSAHTYARRYGMAAMIGIAPEDDDGNAASGNHPVKEAAQVVRNDPPQPSRNGKPPAPDKREQLATTMIAALNEATTLEEIAAVAKLAPKGWFTVKDAHNKTVTDAAERRKLFVLADLIDAWADEAKLDAPQLEMLCNDLDINMKTMNSAQAQKLVDVLKKLPTPVTA